MEEICKYCKHCLILLNADFQPVCHVCGSFADKSIIMMFDEKFSLYDRCEEFIPRRKEWIDRIR